MEYIQLNNGVEMPMLGYGVYQIPPRITERCVTDAITAGYRAIDTAQCYGNEGSVGAAIAKSDIQRSKFFITTKVWTSGYSNTQRSIEVSLQQLKSDYVDLLLIHEPSSDNIGTYRALEDAYKEGKTRAIGLSNYYQNNFNEIINSCSILPAVNQIETHVFWQQQRMREFLEPFGTRLESWAPFAEGLNGMFHNPVLMSIGQKHRKSVAQTVLRFFLQEGVVAIPKSTHMDRMVENFDIFDFALDQGDMDRIRALDQNRTLFFWP